MERIKETENATTSDPTQPVKIFKSDSTKALTVPQLLSRAVEIFPNHVALKYQKEGSKIWQEITYKDYKNRVDKLAKCFIKLGLKEHESVAILAFNCPEWFITELAVIHAGFYLKTFYCSVVAGDFETDKFNPFGELNIQFTRRFGVHFCGIAIGIYNTNSSDACKFILNSSRAKFIVVDDLEQLKKILKIKSQCEYLQNIIKIQKDPQDIAFEFFYRWKDLEAMNVDDVQEEFELRLKNIFANFCCLICFTSGTTGNPKGVMLSHDSLIWNTFNYLNYLGSLNFGLEIFVSFLPLSHIAAQFLDIFGPIALCGTVYFADKNALKGSLVETLIEARPTFFLAVPRVYEKIEEKVSSSLNELKGISRILMNWSQNVAINQKNSIQYKIANHLVLNKIKQNLGMDQVKFCMVGAAPSNVETLNFFASIGLPLINTFGMSELSGLSNICKELRFESVGKNLPETEMKIVNPDSNGCGEVCFRGRNTFMGYLNDIERTKECIDDDQWLHTGDLGRIDSKGFLYVTGRIKELLITAGGENIPFLHIEGLVKRECPAISNAFLVGDKRKFLSMLITLKTEFDDENSSTDILALDSLKFVKSLNLNFTKLSEVKNHPKVIEAIQTSIDRANEKSISNAQKVQKFKILPHDFSIATQELSPTLKVKRSFVVTKYEKNIEKFYEAK